MPQNGLVAFGSKKPSGAPVLASTDPQSASFDTQRHGALYAASYAGSLFLGANQAGATTSAALATTYTGLCLSNPAASGKNLSLVRVIGTVNVAPAALTSYGLIAGWLAAGITVHTTPITALGSAFINGTAGVGLLDAACTLVGTPFWASWFGETPAATSVVSFNIGYEGAIIIPPGGYVAIGTTVAGPAAGLFGSMIWEEEPI